MVKRLVLIAALALVTVVGSVAMDTPQAAEASADCTGFLNQSFPGIDVPPINQSGLTTVTVDANEALTISMTVVSGSGTHWLEVNGVTVAGPVSWTEPLSYTFPSDGTYQFNHWLSGNGTLDIVWGCGQVVAGCDVMVAIPSTAVVGQFTENAQFFYAPQADAGTNTVIEVGKTFWVDGLDETGMYRKTLVNCTWGWVAVGTVGPNYDDVWNGTPLPGHTVE